MAPASSFSLEKIKKEIEKCVLLCRNCHADYHYQEDHKENGKYTDYQRLDI